MCVYLAEYVEYALDTVSISTVFVSPVCTFNTIQFSCQTSSYFFAKPCTIVCRLELMHMHVFVYVRLHTRQSI